jgi:splicing factor 3B subunit 2
VGGLHFTTELIPLSPFFHSGLITPGGFSSVPAGMETPELIELRKKKIEEAMDG